MLSGYNIHEVNCVRRIKCKVRGVVAVKMEIQLMVLYDEWYYGLQDLDFVYAS